MTSEQEVAELIAKAKRCHAAGNAHAMYVTASDVAAGTNPTCDNCGASIEVITVTTLPLPHFGPMTPAKDC